MTRSRAGRFGFLAVLTVLGATVVFASPHQLFLDFDTDDNLWTINPYAAGVPVSFIVQIGDDPIGPSAGVLLMFELGCYYDPESMETANCAMIDCEPDWCTSGILCDCYVDCPPVAACFDAMLTGATDPSFTPQPGERCRIGTRWIYGTGSDASCEGAGYHAYGDFAGNLVSSNTIWLENAASAPEDEPLTDSPTWGEVKARFRDPR